MIKKPNKCCEMGTYEHQVPMPIKGRRQDVDICIADIVAALNAANIRTEASCCGHGKMTGNIILEDGRELMIGNSPEVIKRMRVLGTHLVGDENAADIKLGLGGETLDEYINKYHRDTE